MNIKKTLDVLKTNILCEHKTKYIGDNFFHNHDGYELFLLLDGEMNYYAEQQGAHLRRGNLVCIKPYDFHRREITETIAYDRIVINIKELCMERLSTKQTDLSSCFYGTPVGKSNIFQLNERETMEYTLCAHRLIQALESNQYGSDVLTDIYIKKILIMVNQLYHNQKAVGTKNIMPSLVSDTIAYIEQHLVEKITLAILSEYFHHNGTYISRCFKNTTGIPLQQYIIKKRITIAKKYLAEGRSPNDTSYLAGFNDYSNFSRTFAKYVGLSPRRFQSGKRRDDNMRQGIRGA